MLQAPRSDRTQTRRLLPALYAGLALAAGLRVALIDRHGLWNNELITYGILWRSYGGIISERLNVNHMPLYFLMEKAWTDVFGTSEISMRAIGAFFGWMAVWATGRLARRIGGLRLAIPVVFAAALNQLWVSTSLEARMYSMLSWAAVEATDAWFAWARGAATNRAGGRRLDLVRWMLVSVLGIYVHMLYGIVLALHLVDASVRAWRQRLPLRPLALALAATAVLCIPITVAWAVNQKKFNQGGSDVEFKTPGVLLRKTLQLFAGDYKTIESDIPRAVAYFLLILAMGGLAYLFSRTRRGGVPFPGGDDASRRDLAALGIGYLLFLAGIFTAQGFSSSSIIGEERYYAPFFPAVIILGFAGFMGLSIRFPRVGVLLIAGGVIFQLIYTTAYYRGVGEGLREGVQTVLADMPEGRGLVCVMSGGGRIGLEKYYGSNLPSSVLELDRTEKSLGRTQRQIDAYAGKFPEFWVVTYHEKEDTVWKALTRHESGYRALTETREFGKTKVRLFSRESFGNPPPATDGDA